MGSQKERVVIRGNEFYEIDLECERRKREGKPCKEDENRSRETREKRRR